MTPKNNEPTLVNKDIPSQTDNDATSKILWVYGVHSRIINRAAFDILNPSGKRFEKVRLQLGLRFDELVIPIFPMIRNRQKVLENLLEMDIPEATILVLGRSGDKKNKKIYRLYKGSKAIFTSPSERQYYIDIGDPDSFPWKKVKEERGGWVEFLKKKFKDVTIIK